jgi:D-alanyl-D-alanine carboxypeptidase
MPVAGRSQRCGHVHRLAAHNLLPGWALLLLLVLVTACGQPAGYGGYVEFGAPPIGGSYAPTHYYPPPGPPDDPWGPYIREAAGRYGVPEQWIRAVMKQESGGQEQATSPAGAMGLMQVMPATYEGLRDRYALGADPYDPHNNILAGSAYIREMYDRFGAPAFLAAYNAGPDRVESYLAGSSSLPEETVNYLAAVTPNLGDQVAMSGPLATYGAGGTSYRVASAGPSAASLAAGCDLSAAYDPNHPCTTLMQAASAPAPVQQAMLVATGPGGCNLSAAYDPDHPCTTAGESAAAAAASPAPVSPSPVRQGSAGGCDPSAAYDPDHPCVPAAPQAAKPSRQTALAFAADEMSEPAPAAPRRAPRVELASAEGCDPNTAYDPAAPCRAAVSAAATAPQAAPPPLFRPSSALSAAAEEGAALEIGAQMLAVPQRNWGVQVGAFASPGLARAVAEAARAEAPGQLRAAAISLPPVSISGAVLYRARLVNLSASGAANACTNLNRRQLPCVVVQPSRG